MCSTFADDEPLKFLEAIVAARLWGPSDMVLFDVGASGGIDARWSVFDPLLTAVGFEPLLAEVERLTLSETRNRVRYEAARVVCRGYDDVFPPALRADPVATRCVQPANRSSSVAARRIQKTDYVRQIYNAGAEVAYTDRRVTLDEYCDEHALRPDFLKIDTDGSDFEVLLGAEGILGTPDLLGIQIECQLHGAVHPYANTFANIDDRLRRHGFSLFDLECYRYSRAALPAPFAIGVPAQTISGQIRWAEAVYFRDLGHPAYAQYFGTAPTREHALKLCCLFSLYGFEDCAAELLATAHCVQDLPERDELLDQLVPRLFGDNRYADYLARFHRDPSAWLPQNIGAAPVPSDQPRPEPAALTDEEAFALEGALFTDGPVSEKAITARRLETENERLRAEASQLRARVTRLTEVRGRIRARLRKLDDAFEKLRTQARHTGGHSPVARR